ncbi:MAG: hypothetical protein HYY76_18450 [Acidobacteria bacterium]|nr:hypothetical protein [Acidobacteriota bacterium]
MTDRIYYTDPFCRTFEATVTRAFEREGRAAVLLDRTAFYPASGGQPFDTGRLGGAEVVETIDGDEVVHVVSAPLAQGAVVRGEIDWARRFDHMQQHTGQHVLSAAFVRLFDNPTSGFHTGAEVSTIDLAREASTRDIERAVDLANGVVWEDRAVSIRFVSPEEAGALALRKEPVRTGPLRLIDIEGIDVCPCGGTHVARTGAVGLVAALGAERLRGGTRLTFICGGRALRALRTYRDAVAGSIRFLSVLPGELPSAVERVQTELKDLQKRIKELRGRLAAHEGARLMAEAPEVAGSRVLVQRIDEADAADLKARALAAVAVTRGVAVLLAPGPPVALVVARSDGVALDANALLRQLLERFGGRGGGKADLAQGGGLSAPAEEIVAAARTLVEAALRA